MKTLHLAVIAILSIIVFININSAFAAVELDAYLPMSGQPVYPHFKFTKTISIDYSNGGKLKDYLDGKDRTISFTDDSTKNPDIMFLVDKINQAIADQRKSTATVSGLRLAYTARIHGYSTGATIDYTLELIPTLTGYVLNSGYGDTQTTIDASWIGFSVKDPIIVSTKQYGNIEINYPLGVIQNTMPDVYYILKGTNAENTLNENLIQAHSLFNTPIDKWNSLTDPLYTLTDTAGLYQGQKVFATTFSSGILGVTGAAADFTGDVPYHISISSKMPQGTINVQGHANAFFVQGEPAFSTAENTVTGEAPVGGFSNGVILAIVIIAAGIVVLFWWFVKRGFSK